MTKSLRATVALSIATSLGCHPAAEAPPVAPEPPGELPSSSFAWTAVRPASAAAPEEYPARLLRTAGSEAVVVPPLPARVLGLSVRPGDTVAANDPVARVVMPEVDAALASVAAAESSLVILRRRRAQLAPLEGDGLVRAADVAALDLEIARHAAERLRGRAVLAGAGVQHGGAIVLRSPIAGVVTEVPATLGELRRPEDGPLARVRSRTGQRVEATFPTRPSEGVTYAYRSSAGVLPLVRINQVPAPTGVGYVAWFEAPAGAEMPTAAEGRVLVQPTASPGAWLVPAASVGAHDAGRFVVARTRAGGAPTAVPVTVVRIAGADALVRGALTDGALVASDPARGEALADAGARP